LKSPPLRWLRLRKFAISQLSGRPSPSLSSIYAADALVTVPALLVTTTEYWPSLEDFVAI
jgi:hypothetical protein